MLPELTFARKLTGRMAPPAAGTSCTFEKLFSPMAMMASQRPSGDQAGGSAPSASPNRPSARRRSVCAARSSARSSRWFRTKASVLPSGEKRGASSVAAPRVNCVSAPLAKS